MEQGRWGAALQKSLSYPAFKVVMRDITHEAVGKGRTRIVSDLERRVEKGKMSAEEKETILGRLSTTTSMDDFKDV